ncbi:hypothetical protein LCGC14_1850320 [marine sediment metagenome]|uniref:Uncharacterized protein n=1 Tax=marine sediment metagenome TaxID=412755 RepID=A0A0F9GAK1_9ZZZZ|nr:hypothetical protein [Desulfobacterales bacterium]
MAFTAANLTSVETAIMNLATGASAVQVTIGDKSITYRKLDLLTLRSLRDLIRMELAASTSFSNKVRFDAPT